jgi:RimJ/RimL family protein N-acetyltransferase
MNAQALFDLQLELECKRIEGRDTIVRVPCGHPDEISRCLITYIDGAYGVYYRYDLPATTRARLAAVPAERLFVDRERVGEILAADAPCKSIWVGKTYRFPEILVPELRTHAVRLNDRRHADVLARYEGGTVIGERVVYGVIADGQVVAACEASRENDQAAEAWVRTVPAYRRRGYAREVTAAWAYAIQQQGKIPFYSHAVDNDASAAVARSLGLICFLSAVGYE